jgi:two-component system chemotaxis sensor kinase CheA
VVKPLGRYLGDVAGISGSTILGSGRVALILDVPVILRNAATAGGGA